MRFSEGYETKGRSDLVVRWSSAWDKCSSFWQLRWKLLKKSATSSKSRAFYTSLSQNAPKSAKLQIEYKDPFSRTSCQGCEKKLENTSERRHYEFFIFSVGYSLAMTCRWGQCSWPVCRVAGIRIWPRNPPAAAQMPRESVSAPHWSCLENRARICKRLWEYGAQKSTPSLCSMANRYAK